MSEESSVTARLRGRVAELAAAGRIATELPEGPQLSWADLERRASGLAGRLTLLGVGAGVRAAAVFDEGSWCDFVVACYGVWFAGGALVPVSAAWPAVRREQVLEQSEASVVVSVGEPAADGELTVAVLRGASRVDAAVRPAGPDDLATVTATSGSGGVPRLVGAVYRDAFDLFDDADGDFDDAGDDAEDAGDDVEDAGDDVEDADGGAAPGLRGGQSPAPEPVLLAVPAIGTAAAQHLVSGLLNGARLLAVPRFDAGRDADLLATRSVTVVSLMPSLARGLVTEVTSRDIDVSSVRSFVCSSAPLAPELFDRVAAAFPDAVVMNAFAMSEGVFLVNAYGSGPASSIGRADAETDVRIVDADGREVGPGVVGEIWLRNRTGPPRRQLGGPRAGGTVIRPDGWVATADLGYTDPQGWVYFAGRRDDIVTVAGSSVSLYAVERCLGRNRAVAEVAVVGVPDPVLGDRVVAYVTLAEPVGVHALHTHCAAGLAPAERPSTVVVLGELPRLPGGKVDRRALRAVDYSAGADPAPAPILDVVRSCWHAVLGGTPPGDDDDLSLVGSFSLLGSEVAGRVGAALGRQVTPGLVVQHPTIGGLAAELLARSADGSLPARPTIRRAPRR